MRLSINSLTIILSTILFIVFAVASSFAQSSAFTYQGKLTDAGGSANGIYQIQFALFDSVSGGNQTGSVITNSNVQVAGGVFTVELDFGSNAYSGAPRFLQISVFSTSSNSYIALTPRQQITSSPYAVRALETQNFSGSLSGDVTGPQTATVVGNVGGKSAAQVSTSVDDTTNATPAVSGNSLVKRDASGNFSGDDITATVLTVPNNAVMNATQTTLTGTSGLVWQAPSGGSGAIPASGAGVRMMWYPAKEAFRAGKVTSTQWDDANVGNYSLAAGFNATASGETSVSLGDNTAATGTDSVALGSFTTASGSVSMAIGSQVTASGNRSMALGNNASTNGFSGAFVYGDNSSSTALNATVTNQFVVRSQNIWLGKTNAVTNTANRFIETSTGAYLSTSGVWTDNSSRFLKTNFSSISPRLVLNKVLSLPIQTWNYKADPLDIRHIGVMAQDFYSAFKVGADNEHISAVDTAGVAMAAIQGLNEKVDENNAASKTENESLRTQLKTQQERLDRQDWMILELKKLVCPGQDSIGVCKQ